MFKKKKQPKTGDPVKEMMDTGSSFTDPQGSWTGKPQDKWETPVQDADDL